MQMQKFAVEHCSPLWTQGFSAQSTIARGFTREAGTSADLFYDHVKICEDN